MEAWYSYHVLRRHQEAFLSAHILLLGRLSREVRFLPLFIEITSAHDVSNRILLAGIRNLGRCPCPRCLVPLARIHNLGMAGDMSLRVNSARTDDVHRRNLVVAARRNLNENHLAVNCAAVEKLLGEFSLVPNKVPSIHITFVCQTLIFMILNRMLSQSSCVPSDCISIRSFSQTSWMKLR